MGVDDVAGSLILKLTLHALLGLMVSRQLLDELVKK